MSAESRELPAWVQAAQKAIQEDVELHPLTQVKDEFPAAWDSLTRPALDGSSRVSGYDEMEELPRNWEGAPPEAGFTCKDCPQPLRPFPVGELKTVYKGKEQRPVRIATMQYTERCTSCATAIKRWQDGRKMADRAILVATTHHRARRVAFVTLTTKNYPKELSEAEAIRKFKKEVSKWRRNAAVAEHVLGGIDYFECTTNPDDGSKNAHLHGVWVMASFWKQSEMLESWKRGGVHIKECRQPKKAAYYCTSYGSKAPVEGVRCKETWGACRGKEFEEIVSAAEES